MHCPFCAADDTKVIDSRLVAEGTEVRRRRACQSCSERFTTFETAELVMPQVVKRDGVRQPFDEHKLRAGLMRALEKRPVSADQIETCVNQIKQTLRATGERELPSLSVGEAVMNALRGVDGVAYVRFASVYRDFQDVSEFQEAVDGLVEADALTTGQLSLLGEQPARGGSVNRLNAASRKPAGAPGKKPRS